MKKFLEKAKNNERFLFFIEKNALDDFHDWKITIIFYAAIHYIKALLKFKRKPSVFNHREMDNMINPSNSSALYPFPQNEYECYSELYTDSRNARYTPVYSTDFQILLLKVICDNSKRNLNKIKNFIISEGLKID